MSIEGIKEQKEILEMPEEQKFDSLEDLKKHLEKLYENEKRQETVSHFTFGDDFNSDELVEEDLNSWNLFQDFLLGEATLDFIQGQLREIQMKLFREDMSVSSRGKFYSYISSRAMGKLLKERQGKSESGHN